MVFFGSDTSASFGDTLVGCGWRFAFNIYINTLYIYIILRYTIQHGWTALVWACKNNAKDVVDLLLKAGANVNQANTVL